MTSRPALGVQPRQAQRSLSGSGLSQRPAHQRSLSQQYLPQSPIRKEAPTARKDATAFLDPNQPDPNDAAQARYAAQRRVGSRLRLELSHDTAGTIAQVGISESPNALDSSKPITPSRVMPSTDASDMGDMSPRVFTRAPTDEADLIPLPLPPRRLRFTLPVCRRDAPPANPIPIKKDSRPKPYTVEIPSAAPWYKARAGTEQTPKATATGPAPGGSRSPSGQGYADFYPWTGDHPEDNFSEHVIRHGFFDKAPVAQTETSSAKGALFGVLKHKSGLHALSAVFAGVLGHRRHNGRITMPSTFKPPPRVTLTDTKREMWLKDLANPAISLRRLSRTIPHGIRGKVLLDQCLNKGVPVDRAIWLAKCVGANEIRAFKRKGVNGTFAMGGEAKWIRDWTVFVEQFVESVFSAFGDAEWKPKVNYAIRLATHLYAEHLLDRDHYMEWLVSGLENSTQAKLPMWMLITEIYWKDLLTMRKSGRRLVTALLSHLHVIQNHPDKDILSPLSSRLISLLSTLMVASPENFISPTAWFKYHNTLLSSLPADDEPHRNILRQITLRNEQLIAANNRSRPAARHILVKILDTTLQSFVSDELPGQCWNVARDKSALVRALLEWCTSMYRPGVAKVYVARRVLLSWAALGLDVTAEILDFLDSEGLEEPGRSTALYHLVCELVRSGQLSVPSYIQWLIARGGIVKEQDVSPEGPCGTRLLVELPTHALTHSQRTLRAGMLRRASFYVDDEAKDTEMAIRCLQSTLGMPTEPTDEMLPRKPLSLNKLSKRIALSSRTLKAEVGSWLRNSLVANLEQASKNGQRGPEISPSTFYALRTIFEAAGDFAMLADVLKSISRVSSVDILASCADTLNRHLSVFAALGVGKDLFDTFHERLKSITEEQGIGARPLLASLASLAPRIPNLENLAAQLSRDLAQSDRNNPVDACSPVSDNMGARLQDNDSDLHEEIEKHLTSGTTIDHNTMDRFFQLVTARLQNSWDRSTDTQRAYSLLLARLRVFEPQLFDSFMAKWVSRIRSIPDRPSILQIFPVLVSVGCLSIPLILASTFADPSTAAGNGPARAAASNPAVTLQLIQMTYRTRYIQEVLEFVMMPALPDSLLAAEECYRIAILQEQAQRENSNDVLAVIKLALAEYSFCRDRNDTGALPLDGPATKDRLIGLLRSLALKDTSGVSRALAIKSPDPLVGNFIDCLATKLLIPTADDSSQVTFDQVLELTNEFTLPFCQLKLSLSLAQVDQNSQDAADQLQSHLEHFTKAMDNAIDAKNITWTGILSSLSPEITHHLKNSAQSRFLGLLPSATNPAPADRTLEQNLQMAENLLSVIDAIIRGGSMGRPPQLVPAIVDKLGDLWETLVSADGETKAAVVNHWLPSLLTFITLHTATFDTSRAGNEVNAKALIIFCGILQELDVVQGYGIDAGSAKALSDRIFDLSLLLVDNIADEARAHCIRAVKEAGGSDARLRYIFSFARPPAEHLMLSHADKQGAEPATRGPGRGSAPIPGAGLLLGTPASVWGQGPVGPERLSAFHLRRWEMLNEPTPNIGENDTALSLGLFEARKV